MNYVTRHCRIKQNTLVSQGAVIYKQEGSLDVFLDGALKALSINYPKYYKMDRLSKLGFLATELMVAERNLIQHVGAQGVAVVLSNAHASLDTDLRYFDSTKTIASPALFVYTLTNIAMGEICIRHGIKGENAFFVQPAFDPEMLAAYVDSVMAAEKTQVCIAGWLDVMGDHHDVFLYLAEKQRPAVDAIEHTTDNLQKLYHSDLWNS